MRDDAEFTLYRGRQRGNPTPVLVVGSAAEQPLPQSLRRLELEYSLAAELEPGWAARPLALTRHEGRTILVIANLAASPWTAFLSGTGSSHSIRLAFCASQLAWRRRSATSIGAV
jgi:hypothetical protein